MLQQSRAKTKHRQPVRRAASVNRGRAAEQRRKRPKGYYIDEYFGFLRKENWRGCIAKGSFDISFFLLVMVLLTIGLVMMFSASYVNARYTQGNSYHYISRQLVFAVIGLAIMWLISKIKPDVFKLFAPIMLAISFALLIYVLINPMEIEGKENFKRWISVPIIGQLQPSDIAKFGLILFCAWHMEKNQRRIARDWKAMIPYLVVIGAMCVLVMLEDHLSGTILIFGIGVVMTYLGGIKKGWYIIGAAAVAALAVFIIANPQILDDYAGDRIQAWLDEDFSPDDKRWQINQALYAIGSGGLFGAGLGQSKQKHMYIPEPQNDFIFAVVCEELGFIGAVVIILLFALLVWRGFMIALRAKDRFSSLLVMGICFHVGLQAALNIAVVTGTIPNTGISLPFFSYGGTALVMLLAEMGMVLSVSRYAKIPKL